MKKLLNVNEVREQVFEKQVSRDKIYEWVRQGRIPYLSLDRKILFNRDTIKQWLRDQEQR